ncbi:MAG: ABC transporter substrate-binding protein [Calditrichales bacterium]|nr:MAG: ABC transporter substrate-binding protein [Calditrichales bacterium]
MRLFFVMIVVLMLSGLSFGQTDIKFATVAPDGSTWMKVMREYVKALEDETNNQVSFKIFPGGVAGDELVVLRKIRIGQLDSGGFTGVGLGEIVPEARIMDSPFLFRSYDEVDYIHGQLFDYFSEKFEEKGYVLLGWAEVGFVYVFTNQPVNALEDMSGVKMWMWEGDPIAEATFKSIGISPIPLSITDVMTSLQTNLINGVYVSPLACVALQWHTKVKYMLNMPLADSNGAVLISKKKFNRLSDSEKEILKRLSRKYFDELTRLSREDNAKSLALMKEAGISFTTIEDKSKIAGFYESGKTARNNLIGKLYDKEFLSRVEKLLESYRNGISK